MKHNLQRYLRFVREPARQAYAVEIVALGMRACFAFLVSPDDQLQTIEIRKLFLQAQRLQLLANTGCCQA